MLLRPLLPRLLSTAAASSFVSILQDHHSSPNLELLLSKSAHPLTPSTLQSVLSSCASSRPVPALRFFVWAACRHRHRHRHSAFAYDAASHSLRLQDHPDALFLLLDSYRRSSVPVPIHAFKVLLNLCLHSNLVAPALFLLEEMPAFGCFPDTPCFNIVLRIVTRNLETCDSSVALEVFDRMSVAGVRPDMAGFVLLIRALCKSGRFSDAKGMIRRMSSNGCVPNKVVLTALFDGALVAGDFGSAMEMLDQMEGSEDAACLPNVVTYTCLMKWLCENERLEEALGVLERMGSRGCRPNRVTVQTLLRSFCSGGHIDAAYEFVEKMIGEGSVSSEECHSLLVACLLRVGATNEAEGLLRRMLEKDIRPDGLASDSLMNALCLENRFSDAYSWICVLEEKASLCFSSDVYSRILAGLCEHGRLEEALALNKRIDGRGIKVDDVCVHGVAQILKGVVKMSWDTK